MKRTELLKKKIKSFLNKKQLLKDEEYAKLEKPYLIKARKNFTVANILINISDNEKLKELLKLPNDFEIFDWVIIAAYYSMYSSALAALAKLEFRSKSHSATIAILEYYYLHQEKSLEIKHLFKFSKAHQLSEHLISKLIKVKSKRETVQYNATPSISRENAKSALEDADEFITKIEEIS